MVEAGLCWLADWRLSDLRTHLPLVGRSHHDPRRAREATKEPSMRASRSLQFTVAALAVWQILAAGLSTSGVLPGDDVGTISDRYDSWIDPAGYAFSIWGVIYLASLVLAAYQVRADRAADPVLRGLRVPLAVAFTLNGVWIIAFQQEQFALSQVIIVALTAALAIGYLRLARAGRPRTRAERWIVYATTGLYLGWGTVATVAGFSTTTLALGVTSLGLPTQVWAVAVLIVAGGIVAAIVAAGPPEPGFPLATSWALTAIAVNQAGPRPIVATVAGLAAAAAIIAFIIRERRWNKVGGAIADREEDPLPSPV